MKTLKQTLNILLLLTGMLTFPFFMWLFEITPLTILAGILSSVFIITLSLLTQIKN